MFNKKGFIALEAVFYIIIAIIMLMMVNTLILKISVFQPNQNIKVYQSLNLLKNSLIRYDRITKFSSKEIELNDYVKVKIKDDQLYETPGFMPYLQGISNAKYTYEHKQLFLSFTYQNQKYKSIIFYDKK